MWCQIQPGGGGGGEGGQGLFPRRLEGSRVCRSHRQGVHLDVTFPLSRDHVRGLTDLGHKLNDTLIEMDYH